MWPGLLRFLRLFCRPGILLLVSACSPPPNEPVDDCNIVQFDAQLGAGEHECRIIFDDNGIDTCGPYAGWRCALLMAGEKIQIADLQEISTLNAPLNDDGTCPLRCY